MIKADGVLLIVVLFCLSRFRNGFLHRHFCAWICIAPLLPWWPRPACCILFPRILLLFGALVCLFLPRFVRGASRRRGEQWAGRLQLLSSD